MRILVMTLIALGIGGGMYYVMFSNQGSMKEQVHTAEDSAQKAAAAYKKNQEDMMKQMGQ